jgi:adenosylmethionine-8-amino-7-oxononanoate aminotransferase
MGVTVASDSVHEKFAGAVRNELFAHGHSYTANPPGCAAALATLELLRQPEWTHRRTMIASVHRQFLDEAARCAGVCRTRLCGTIAAFDLDVEEPGYHSPAGGRVAAWLRNNTADSPGLWLRPLGNTMYLMPPYCISDSQLEHAWRQLLRAVEAAGPQARQT